MHSSSASAYLWHHLWPFYGHPHTHDDIMQPLPQLCPSALPSLSGMPLPLPALGPMTYALAPPPPMHNAHGITYDHVVVHIS